MVKICVFAGTTEGRELVEFLSTQPVEVTACVATEYGETLLPTAENLTISAKRLPVQEITQMLSATPFDLVVDATHPYATAVTESITAACQSTGTEYLRLMRQASSVSSQAVFVPDIPGAVAFLNTTEGNILLTTGAKELIKYTDLQNFSQRVYARVLPMETSLQACRDAGVLPSHIIAMQGPFSQEVNTAMLHFVSAQWLVTKDGGEAGGFGEKVAAAQKAGAKLVVIGRPPQREGLSFLETIELLCRRFGCSRSPHVQIVGIGPGNRDAMTREVLDAIEKADCLIGAKRMLEAVAHAGQWIQEAIAPGEIAQYILSHPEYHRFVVVMSGDIGFFSGTKKLLPLLDGCVVETLPGLSSLAYLCARLQTSYEEVFVTSVHGRQQDIIPDIRSHPQVFALTGGKIGVQELCRTLTQRGLGQVRVSIGERLSYPDEKITRGTAQELAQGQYAPLSAVLIENDFPCTVVTHGLPDSRFRRSGSGETIVPMTKMEVRSVCLSKLQLTQRAICWDIGAGTGSVAIEMALQACKGQVYAIEKNEAATALLEQNKAHFSVENLTVVGGYAPQACLALPTPTHAFIGGSSGNLPEILTLLLEKNPWVRIVATAISLESIGELTRCIRQFPCLETEVVSLQVARDTKAGSYHLMTGQNPVYIFTMQAAEHPL